MNNMWKKVFIFLSAYLSIIAFAVLGGVIWYKKDEDEDVKKTLKLALILTLIFTAISAFLSIYNHIGSLCLGYYSSTAYDFYDIVSTIVALAKIIVFAIFIIIEIVNKFKNKEVENEISANDISGSNDPKQINTEILGEKENLTRNIKKKNAKNKIEEE